VRKAGFIAIALIAFGEEKLRSVWDGVYTKEQAERGHIRYDAVCAECHGDELEGDLVEAPALAGTEFLWKFNGTTLDHVFRRVHRDMPLTKSGTLSKEVSADIVAYMLSQCNLPAGSRELPHEEPLLRQIRIDAERPKE
jgi:mono/diheme cytochrome c family protein